MDSCGLKKFMAHVQTAFMFSENKGSERFKLNFYLALFLEIDKTLSNKPVLHFNKTYYINYEIL